MKNYDDMADYHMGNGRRLRKIGERHGEEMSDDFKPKSEKLILIIKNSWIRDLQITRSTLKTK